MANILLLSLLENTLEPLGKLTNSGPLSPTKVKPPKKRKKVNKDSKMYATAKAYKEKQKLKRALNKQKDFLDGKVKN